MEDCWKSCAPCQVKRGPHGVLLVFKRSTCPALPVVIKVGRCSTVPWQSMQLMRGRVARLAVKLAVAVDVDFEMAIDALHAAREMDVFQMHRFGEFLRIVVRDLVVVQIEQVAFAILLEDGAEDPAVAVVVGELRVLQLRIQLRHARRGTQDRPRARARPRPRDFSAWPTTSSASVGSCCFAGYMNSPSVSWSHQV